MTRPLRGVAVALALASLGCGGLLGPPPQIDALGVTTDACGNWTATIDAQGTGQSLAVGQDGVIVQSWDVNGKQQLVAHGTAPPGRRITISARLEDSRQDAAVTMPPMDATLTITPTDGVFPPETAATFDATLTTTCTVGGLSANAVLYDGSDPNHHAAWTSTAIPLTPNVPAKVVVPPPGRGLYDVEITVDADTTTVATARAHAYWGEADDDLDRDGVPGGLDGGDCDDHDPHVGPFATEAPDPNGKDDDCDGTTDEGTIAYDDDGDGVSEQQGDCDDGDAGRYPKAPEVADCRDNNCDGTTDEGVTLAQKDDAYEPDDTAAHAYDLQTSRQKSFSQELVPITRDAQDDEWFKFFSQDGDWDSWGIDVVANGIPEGATYEIGLYQDGDSRINEVTVTAGSHSTLVQRGAMFRDDSGDYLIRIHPVKITKSWCPVSVTLTSY